MTKNYHLGFIVTLFLLLGYNASGQERKILEGRVLADSLKKIEAIHVINLTAESGTATDENGEFRLLSKAGDTIYFSSLQFQNKSLVVRPVHLIEGIRVRLYPAISELDEVRLSDIKLIGSLERDIEKIKTFDRSKFGIPFPEKRPTQTERHLYTATTSSGGIPLDLILNTINGRIKMLKKVKRNDELSANVQRGLVMLGKDYFLNGLGIPEEEIVNFLYYCMAFPEFAIAVEQKEILSMMEFTQEHLSSFRELRQLE